ncbi:hypothetical protein GH714_021273 [Hevea brasiliensis]|uniref:Uncharacterized protein n=1 Tax=Hevea brasiliensis TaxID=3981 RepID=A0A6A6L3X1_HEVBR|nr:hypothetical protein GH714_021273 [Hevea brasiliensis]
MSEEYLEMVNRFGATALHLAAAIGATRIVELLITKNKKLVTIPTQGQLPITIACVKGHRDTTWFLYSNSPFDWLLQENGYFGARLLIYSLYIKMFGLKQIYDMKLTRSYALEILQCISKEISTIPDLEIPEIVVDLALFKAVEHGIIEIVIEIIKANPALLNQRVDFQKGIIHAAILFRQAKVYNLVYAVGKQKRFLLDGIYELENNILQLAAKLAPPNRLARISGAALQMQKELRWYKEVESVVDPTFKLAVNNYGEKPSQLFTNTHKQLMEEAEKWTKEIANSCTVVEEDFLELLPKKLIIGLSTLFLSIAAMIIAFCATLIIMLDGDLELIIPIVLMASVLVAIFIFLQFPLLVDIFTSTYGPGMFNKKNEASVRKRSWLCTGNARDPSNCIS